MRRHLRLIALALSCAALNGCIAAIAPIAAAGALGGKQALGQKDGKAAERPAEAAPPQQVAAARVQPEPAIIANTPAPIPVPSVDAPALPTHDWRAMVAHVAEAVQAKTRPVDSAVLAPDSTAEAPRFLPCGTNPFAVIVDAEGTVLPPTDARPGTTVSTEEAARSFELVRFGQVTVIFTSASSADRITATEAALERSRLGPAMQGRELLSAADGPAGASKAGLRVAVTNHYCVLALVGDAPDDFSDLLAAPGGRVAGATRWGAGWFRVPAQVAAP